MEETLETQNKNKIAFYRFINRLDTIDERVSEYENMSIKNSQTLEIKY